MRFAPLALALLFSISALAQQNGAAVNPPIVPPAGAQNIDGPAPAATNASGGYGNAGAATASPAAEDYEQSETVGVPSGVIRIYIANLSGADNQAISGLLTQSLFQSKQVVITENQSNASLILSGQVWREAKAAARSTRSRARRRPASRRTTVPATDSSRQPSSDTDMGAITPPPNAVSLPVDPSSGMSNGSGFSNEAQSSPGGLGADGLGAGLGLAPLGNNGSPADLNAYRYRLDLQLVNPQGDLVWMSGRGDKALPFEAATQAVAQTVAPMLSSIQALAPKPSVGAAAGTAN